MESSSASTRNTVPAAGCRPESTGGAGELDPREASRWFRHLPPSAQEDARRAWREEDEHWESVSARERRDTKRDVAILAGLFAFFGCVTLGLGWPGLVFAPCLGAAIG